MRLYQLALFAFFVLSPPLAFSSKIIYDHDLSPYMGSANLLSAQELLIGGEDFLLPRSGRDSTSKVWGRAIEQFLFWNTLNGLSTVTQHEVFGHGYRLRELGVTPDKYVVAPWWGSTHFKVNDSFLVGNLLAIDVAGLEAEGILARSLKMQWIRCGEIQGRLSSIYTEAQQSLFWYTIITQLGKLKGEEGSEGNDINSYIALHNASYEDSTLTTERLTFWSMFNWLDPMTFYAYYAFFYYIAEGKPWKFPMIPLGETVRYLPNVRIGYAPYGPEAYWENFFSVHEGLFYIYFKGGRSSFGFGTSYSRSIAEDKLTLGFNLDGWNHRVFLSTATVGEFERGETVFRPVLNKSRWGAAFSLAAELRLFSSFGLYSECGVKTSGYLPGHRLGEGLFVRLGLSIGKKS